MAMSRADMVHADTQDGTACKTVPSSFLDGCLNLFSQEVFFGLVGDAIFIGLVGDTVFLDSRCRFAMASWRDDAVGAGVLVPLLEKMDTLLRHSFSI